MEVVKYKFFFEEQWQEVTGKPEQALVQMTIESDIRTPHACLEGGCGSCKCRLVEGKVDMAPTDTLSEEEVAEGYILACQSRALTPVVAVNFDLDD